MQFKFRAMAAAVAIVGASMALSSCATDYGKITLTGGYQEKELEPGIWRVSFYGNGYTTRESVQTYWLFRCAQLAKLKGYDGFQLITPVQLTGYARPVADPQARLIRTRGGGGGHGGGGHYVYYGGAYAVSPHPYLQADVRLIRKPFTTVPGKVFDADELTAQLSPIVTGKKCGGNVCPHVHRYLYPVPPGDKPA